jgi:hypothetical protein
MRFSVDESMEVGESESNFPCLETFGLQTPRLFMPFCNFFENNSGAGKNKDKSRIFIRQMAMLWQN